MKTGDRIIFTEEITQAPSCGTPMFLLARKNDKGVILRKSKYNEKEWLVQPDGFNPFYAKENEFKKL